MKFYSGPLTTFTDLNDRYWRALALRGIGDTHRDLSSAIHHYEETAEIFTQLGETHREAFVLKQAANIRRLMER